MAISDQAPRFSMLAEFSKATSSDDRRELLRKVTEALDHRDGATPEKISGLDELLAAAASEYSVQIRAEIARLIATQTGFRHTTDKFAMDDIEVAAAILRHSSAISESTLLKVIEGKSQNHLLAITERKSLSENISHALVERGNDAVVCSLLRNETAAIGDETYEEVAHRAQESAVLQMPLIRRSGVPIELLNELYVKVESDMRREILVKIDALPPDELERAFRRTRARVSTTYSQQPKDFAEAERRIGTTERAGNLVPPLLASLLREGAAGRTAFKVAFARLAGVPYDHVDRAVEARDLDTIALLCRGASFERAPFVTLALSLAGTDRGVAEADNFRALYESVPVEAAQRALRFWKIRAAA